MLINQKNLLNHIQDRINCFEKIQYETNSVTDRVEAVCIQAELMKLKQWIICDYPNLLEAEEAGFPDFNNSPACYAEKHGA